MAMRYVYHLTVDGAFLGPGSMFVFASVLSLVAAGCAYALPKNRADSRPSVRARMSDIRRYYDESESEFADPSTPFIVRDSEVVPSSRSYGTDDETGSPTRGTEML